MSTLDSKLEQSIRMEEAKHRVEEILGPKPVESKQTEFNPTNFELTTAPAKTVEQKLSDKKSRKKRSDAGVPKSPSDEITLKLSIDVAQQLADATAESFPSLSRHILQQIIQNLLKRVQEKK